ncbi:hypothetical protein KCP73_24645 [Salmonella enterica subsp. enterica]|nr:hypothetical protein KCP73_24645 [Salmonella enterica subsp. enterica]
MMKVDAVKRGTPGSANPAGGTADPRGAMECNGNGLCFNFDAKSSMCPSMKISLNRSTSPKVLAGDAQYGNGSVPLADRGVDPLKLEKELPENAPLRTLIARTRNKLAQTQRRKYDFPGFSRAVRLSGVKPVTTSVRLKSMFRVSFTFSYSFTIRYLRPPRDHSVATVCAPTRAADGACAKAPLTFY